MNKGTVVVTMETHVDLKIFLCVKCILNFESGKKYKYQIHLRRGFFNARAADSCAKRSKTYLLDRSSVAQSPRRDRRRAKLADGVSELQSKIATRFELPFPESSCTFHSKPARLLTLCALCVS